MRDTVRIQPQENHLLLDIRGEGATALRIGPAKPCDPRAPVCVSKERAKTPEQEELRIRVLQARGNPAGIAPRRGRSIERIASESVTNAHAAGATKATKPEERAYL